MDCQGCNKCDPGATGGEGALRLLLMGNPNVGKSVIFSRLTGMDVNTANYAGTTVSYTRGRIRNQGRESLLIDVPGTYSLSATSPAEEVAVKLLSQGAHAVVCVLDATNLERNLPLALQIRQTGVPLVFALNLSDVASRRGIDIDARALSRELGGPVIPTAAVKGAGLKELLDAALAAAGAGRKTGPAADSSGKAEPVSPSAMAAPPPVHLPPAFPDYWEEAGRITAAAQQDRQGPPGLWDRIEALTIQPFPGLPIALLVLITAMGVVVGGGKGLRALVLLPLFDNHVAPAITTAVSSFVAEGVWLNVLVGEYGMLIKGIEWPIALILPYVALFYVVMSFLEDSGYLPRLAVLLDNVMRAMGVQGSSIIPMFMGYGCAVPAILGTKASTSHKERLIVTSLVALAVPCTAQTGAFIVLLGDHSLLALLAVYGFSLAAMFAAGTLMTRLLPGRIDPMLMEIPNLLLPDGRALGKKILLQIKQFLLEAEVPMILGIGAAALIAETGALVHIAAALKPLVTGWLGLPPEASLALMLGIIRRELAVLPLLDLNLSLLQLLVGSLVALFYLPCLTVMAIIIKEFNIRIGLLMLGGTLLVAILLAGVFNQTARLLGFS